MISKQHQVRHGMGKTIFDAGFRFLQTEDIK
jgi:hypothetical protein